MFSVVFSAAKSAASQSTSGEIGRNISVPRAFHLPMESVSRLISSPQAYCVNEAVPLINDRGY